MLKRKWEKGVLSTAHLFVYLCKQLFPGIKSFNKIKLVVHVISSDSDNTSCYKYVEENQSSAL